MEKLLIQTQRLQIRNLKPTDCEAFHAYRSNPEITKYQGFNPMTLPECAAFIESHTDRLFGKPGEWVQYAIENVENNTLVGDCAVRLNEQEPRIAEIGITISHLQQQKGYARETMLGLLGFLFSKGLHRIVETADIENTASVRLMENIGFRKEGVFMENFFDNGKWGSEVQYAMLKSEWDQRKS